MAKKEDFYLIDPLEFNPKRKEIGFKLETLIRREYSSLKQNGEYEIEIYAKVYHIYKKKFLWFWIRKCKFYCMFGREDYVKGKLKNVGQFKSIDDAYNEILKPYNTDKIMEGPEMDKFLKSIGYCQEVMFMSM